MQWLLAAAAPASVPVHPWWPLVVLVICVALVVALIAFVRLHAFVALVLAALVAGVLSRPGTLPGDPAKGHLVRAIEALTVELGVTAGKVTLVIALAAIIGMCLSESGAADKVVRRFLAAFGEKRAGLALLVSGYVLSIPIFFDTFFMLVAPLARALALRTGRHYTLYVLAIIAGSMVTHSLVAPHPGPLAMAEILHLDVGASVLAGLAFGIGPTAVAWLAAKRLDRKVPLPVRPGPDAGETAREAARLGVPESELPSLWASLVPVLGPVLLLAAGSLVGAAPTWRAGHSQAAALVEFFGNRNVALMVGAACACALLMRQRRLRVRELGALMGPPLQTAGVIILIISGGGAFGFMLRNAGVGGAIASLAAGRSVDLVLLSWGLAATLRVAQGSATVAMMTSASMMQPLLAGAALPYHPMYVFLAIGCGAMMLSWMNDAGFWIIAQLTGFTERETLRTFSVLISVGSAAGLVLCLLGSRLLPFVPAVP